MTQFQTPISPDSQEKAASVASAVEDLRTHLNALLSNYDLNSEDETKLKELRDTLQKLNETFEAPSTEQSLEDNLVGDAALKAILHPDSVGNRLTLAKYADPEQSYTRRYEISKQLQNLKLEENLELEGFQRVNESSYYKNGSFVVSVHEGSLSLYVPMDSIFLSGEILEVRGINERNEKGLTIVTKDEKSHRQMSYRAGGGSSSGGNATWTLDHFSSSTAEEQLFEVGFEKDPTTEGIYRLKGQDYIWGTDELIALVDGDKIVSILYGVLPEVMEKGDQHTRVAGIHEIDTQYSVQQMLTLTNDSMEFKVNDRGRIVEGSQYLFREIYPEEVSIVAFEEVREDSGFIIGGMNSSELVRNLQSINGIAIEELEDTMRPGSSSFAGFLDESQRLLELLVQDNNYVRSKNLSHQELAKHLHYVVAMYEQNFGQEFEYNGSTFKIERTQYRGSQSSPFRDGTSTPNDYNLTNLKTGKSISFSGLLPPMIERYGFYEGNSSYRLDPLDVVEVFDFLES